MRRLYIVSTVTFWAAVIAFMGGSAFAPQPEQAGSGAADRTIPLSELSRHASPASCWMAIRGVVYDVSAYLPKHPSRPSVIEPWCGRDATEAYNTKTKGRPHSPNADALLDGYRIGQFAATGR